MIVRIPDTSEKDTKIQAALTRGNNNETERSLAKTRPSSSYIKREFLIANNQIRVYDPVHNQNEQIEIFKKNQEEAQIKNDSSQRNSRNDKETNPRKYSALMDEHALHIFLVRNGKAIEETPEFESFKRVHSSIWGHIKRYISQIEIYCRMLEVKMLKVNGSLLVRKIYRKIKPTAYNLIDCILPYEENNEETSYEQKLERNAATKIQSLCRMILSKIKSRKLRIIYRKIEFIQGWVRTFLAKKSFKKSVIKENNKKYLEFEKLQSKLKEDWEFIKQTGRVELHYNCLGGTELDKLSISKFEQKQNMQIGRIFRAVENGIEIIYVSSSPIPDDVKKYYYKVLQLLGVRNPHKKVHFLVPETLDNFPPHISIASKILYSRGLIKQIKHIVDGRYCLIVGGIPCNDDIKLACYLKYPILSGHPVKNQIVSNLFQSKEVIFF